MNLLLLDSAVIGYEKVQAAANENTRVVVFDRYVDTFQTLQKKITDTENAEAYMAVGIVQHGNVYAPYYNLLESQSVPAIIHDVDTRDPSLDSWSELCEFYSWLKSDYGTTTLDLISCGFWANPGWKYALGKLETELGIDFRASINETGNIANGGDWVQESDGVNIQEIYFTKGIAEFVDLLYTVYFKPSSSMVAAPGTVINGQEIRGSLTSNRIIGSQSLAENMSLRGPINYGNMIARGVAERGVNGLPSGDGFVAFSSTYNAFAVIKNDGTVRAWGQDTLAGTSAPGGSGYVALASTERAFAALKSDGTIVAWGDGLYGGNSPSGSGYISITSNSYAFAALKTDGSIVAWGDTHYGGASPAGSGFVFIASNDWSFAAVRSNGSVLAWGESTYGGTSPPDTDFVSITSHVTSYAGLKSDGSIKAWGNDSSGFPTNAGFVAIAATRAAYAALHADGYIRTWGFSSYGGNFTPSGSNYVCIASSERAFAALKSDGTIVAWGDSAYGGTSPNGSGFKAITSSAEAFAAIKSDGSVFAWGNTAAGGANWPAGTNFTRIASTFRSFAALKTDGSVSMWGVISSSESTGFSNIVSNGYTFVAAKATVPANTNDIISTNTTGNYVLLNSDTTTNISINTKLAIKNFVGSKTNASRDFIKGMIQRLNTNKYIIESSRIGDFKNTLTSGQENLDRQLDIDQYFPDINSLESEAKLNIDSFSTNNTRYISIELPINIPVILFENNIAVGKLLFDGVNVLNQFVTPPIQLTAGNNILFGTKGLVKVAIGSLVGLGMLPPSQPSELRVTNRHDFNTIAYSSDGMQFKGLGKTIFTTKGNGAAWNGNLWVAVGEGTNSIAYSRDGLNWMGLGSNIFTAGRKVAWNGSLWVAVGSGTYKIAYSYDGIAWTGVSSSVFSTSGNGIAWNGLRWVATGTGTNTLAHSTDGLTWTGLGTSIFSVTGNGILWAGPAFWVATGEGATHTLATSVDGLTWIGRGKVFTSYGSDVAYNGVRYVAVGQGSVDTIAYSSDGATWTGAGKSIFPGGNTDYGAGVGVVYNGRLFVVAGKGPVTVAVSGDGINWQPMVNSGTLVSAGNGLATNSGFGAVVPPNQLVISNIDGKPLQVDIVGDAYMDKGLLNINTALQYRLV